jgi:hypothetical protein
MNEKKREITIQTPCVALLSIFNFSIAADRQAGTVCAASRVPGTYINISKFEKEGSEVPTVELRP